MLTSIADDHPIRKAIPNNRHCLAGDYWWWDGVYFEILHPLEPGILLNKRSTNESSCVLKVTTTHGSILLPGDIGRRTEADLLNYASDSLASSVLIAPHHGSRSSSSEAFVRQVDPAWAIFTVGYRSRFGHPHPEIVERYREQGSLLRRSDYDGAVLLDFAQGRVEVVIHGESETVVSGMMNGLWQISQIKCHDSCAVFAYRFSSRINTQ